MPPRPMFHEVDPRDALLNEIGDLSDIEIFNNQVLVAVYIAPQKYASGLLRPESNQDEDRHQSKVGLIVKMGPQAFVDTDNWTFDVQPEVHDWVFFRVSDGWNSTVNGVLCRFLDDVNVRGRIQQPDQVW